MLLTKEQYKNRKDSPEIKAKIWFGNDFIKSDLSKFFDVYTDTYYLYVFKKEVEA